MAKPALKTADDTKIKTAKVPPINVKIAKSDTGIMTIPGVRTERFRTLLIGTSPLILHKFSEKLRKMILDKHMGEASAGKEAKNPHDNFMASRYLLSDGSDGVPAAGLKAAFVAGFDKKSGVPMTKAKGAIRVVADDPATNLVRLIGPENPRAAERVGDPGAWPQMREDVVRNESGVVDIRHRPEFWPWALAVEIEFLPSACSMSQVLQAIAMAGFVEGLAEWRPGSKQSRSGSYGCWQLATAAEVKAFEAGELFAVNGNGRRTRRAA